MNRKTVSKKMSEVLYINKRKYRVTQKNGNFLKTQQKLKKSKKKKIIDRN